MLWNIFYWLFGVGTCAYYAIETVSATYMNPTLSWLFMPLLIVPASNCLMLLTGSGKCASDQDIKWMASLQAIAVAVSSMLLLILLPLVLLAIIGTVICVFVEPKTSLMAMYYILVAVGPFLTSFELYDRIRRRSPKGTKAPGLGRANALALVMSIVLFAILPTTLTRYCQHAAEIPATRSKALLLLRALGDDNTMLKSCYDQYTNMPWYFSFLHWTLDSDGDYDKYRPARELFYRVRGIAFNSVARPNDTSTRDYYYFDDDDWWWYHNWRSDRDFATDTVGGIVKGLSLDQSKITGWVDANEAVSHLNWKMHFANNDSRDSELRGQLLLPPHAVITGCSLWINGVRHEAVFAERSSAKEAYTQSAEKGETPLLVSTAGAGRVLLQSSMGLWGKEAELDIEMTAPLSLVEKGQATLPLPVFSERNFAVSTNHTLDLRSLTALKTNSEFASANDRGVDNSKFHITGKLTNSDICSNKGALGFDRNSAITTVQAVSPLTKETIQETFVAERLSSSAPLVVVVDGSAGMANSIQTICQTLEQQHFTDATLVWASDEPITLASHVDTSSSVWHDAVRRLADSSCLGGQDNGLALSQAVTRGSERDRSINVVWIHATQPIDFSSSNLFEYLNATSNRLKLAEYQIEPGPNAVIKSLDQLSNFEQVPRIKGLAGDMQSLFARLAGTADNIKIQRTPGFATTSVQLSAHPLELAQLSASDTILAQLSDNLKRQENGKMAERLHLVTPLTSALVLETQEMYKEYNVQKFDNESGSQTQSSPMAKAGGPVGMMMPGMISTKPEPPMALLMAIALIITFPALWLIRKRRKFA
ncbi:MAG: hypothetical protein JST01_16455 [Cyanobacteria bacterium SZAS TMP-1]|nr:hypothetical protein [Cyanobacteria bacterium SZAS TMP-1]